MMNFLAIDIFSAYGIVNEFLFDEDIDKVSVFLNGLWVAIQYAVKCLIADVGSRSTKEAEKSVTILMKKLATEKFNNEFKSDLNFLLTQ
ncbi:MAG: hypothetical protein ACRDAX_02870, partial [Propionibacteriaceae bacterium]